MVWVHLSISLHSRTSQLNILTVRAIFRASLDILVSSPTGSLGHGNWQVVLHCCCFTLSLGQAYRTDCCFAVPSLSLYKPKFQQANCSPCYLLRTHFLLGLLFDPKDGGNMFVQNINWLQMDYMVLYSRTLHNHGCENLESYKKQLICCGAGLCYPQYVNGDGVRASSNTYQYTETSY